MPRNSGFTNLLLIIVIIIIGFIVLFLSSLVERTVDLDRRDTTFTVDKNSLVSIKDKILYLGDIAIFQNVGGTNPFLSPDFKTIFIESEKYNDTCYYLKNIFDVGSDELVIKEEIKDSLPLDSDKIDKYRKNDYFSYSCSAPIINSKFYFEINVGDNQYLVEEDVLGDRWGTNVLTSETISSQEIENLLSTDSVRFSYPSNDSAIYNNFLLLQFRREKSGDLMVIESKNKKQLYYKKLSNKDFDLVAGNFSFEMGELPIIGLISGWEGATWPLGLLDVSQEQIRFVDLRDIRGDSVPYYQETFPHFKWRDNDVLFYSYKYLDSKNIVGDMSEKAETYASWEGLPHEELRNKIEEENRRLKNVATNKGYQYTHCEVSLGFGFGCYISEDPNIYSLKPGGDLIQIQ
ncbi:hypothetical protein JXA63_00255 [Candidatus Woesebacteria bacterium]|nr:hypothetical protein [Candidatus Woesebacteria bacterium]